jgi:hypothetical protein
MLCWTDYPAVPYAATALVNNLDLTVTDPGAVAPSSAGPQPRPGPCRRCSRRRDRYAKQYRTGRHQQPHRRQPSPSTSAGPASPRDHRLTRFLRGHPARSVQLLYPYGNETWVPGTTENIRWNAYGTSPIPSPSTIPPTTAAPGPRSAIPYRPPAAASTPGPYPPPPPTAPSSG